MVESSKRRLRLEEWEAKLASGNVFLAADDPSDQWTPGPKPPLFTPKSDIVDFNEIAPGAYAQSSFYSALRGHDVVELPADQATAAALGYNAGNVFHGDLGNDTIVGGALNDLISGDSGNDKLMGGDGDDALAGGTGNDQLFGRAGEDVFIAGNGIDYISGGTGNDVIFATEADQSLLPGGTSTNVPGGAIFRDTIHAGDGDDVIHATNSDYVYAGSGDDTISLTADTFVGWSAGGDGNDTITGSAGNDIISTGLEWLFWSKNSWNPTNEALHGGFEDSVKSGDGNDVILTMLYCNATVETGKGDDSVAVHGLYDIVVTGEGEDTLRLTGGAAQADLGAGNDTVSLTRAPHDNPNHSEITLGAGADHVLFNTDEWLTHGGEQPMEASPLILDFTLGEDTIDHLWLTNIEDASQSLDGANLHCVDIAGGSALVYDDPADNAKDFTFARFQGVTAQDLQAHIDANTTFF
jgi:Ca2+-binding RTX toxin-like protein